MGRGLGLLWKQKLTTGHRILPQAPAGQHPLPPLLLVFLKVPLLLGTAFVLSSGSTGLKGSLGRQNQSDQDNLQPRPTATSISCPETQPLRLEKRLV